MSVKRFRSQHLFLQRQHSYVLVRGGEEEKTLVKALQSAVAGTAADSKDLQKAESLQQATVLVRSALLSLQAPAPVAAASDPLLLSENARIKKVLLFGVEFSAFSHVAGAVCAARGCE